MSKKRFRSPTTGELCTAAQCLAEMMIVRRAKKEGKMPLPWKFWNHDEWKSLYMQQLFAANTLLRIFSPEAVIAALNTKEGSWQYSLRTKSLEPIIVEQQKKLEEIAAQDDNISGVTDYKPRKSTGKPSLRSKLS